MPVRTKTVARLLGINYHRLAAMLRSGKVPEPAKDDSGHFFWSQSDIENVRRAMRIDRRTKAGRQMEVLANG